MTHHEVALRVWITGSALSRLECGRYARPTLDTVEKYALAGGACIEIRVRRGWSGHCAPARTMAPANDRFRGTNRCAATGRSLPTTTSQVPALFWIGLFRAGRLNRMDKPSISRYPVPKLEDLPDDIRARILAVQEKAGFVPNVFVTLAHRPAEFRAFFAYHDALMEKEGGLTKAEREMIVVATSGANDCLYCVVAHGAILRIYAKNPLVADQVAVNPNKADITPRQRAMLAFALKVALHSSQIGDDDFAALKAHGFSDEDAWDIGAIAAFFALSNRMAALVQMRPNDEFFLLGRLPKKA